MQNQELNQVRLISVKRIARKIPYFRSIWQRNAWAHILKLVKSDNTCPCGILLGTRTTINCRCCEWILDHLIEFRFNNIELQLNNNTILNGFDLIIMGGLIHTVANNKHRYQKSENVFSDIMADIYLTQMRNLVKVRLMSQNQIK